MGDSDSSDSSAPPTAPSTDSTDVGERTEVAADLASRPVATPVTEAAARQRDMLIVGGPSSDGNGVQVVRIQDDQVQAGELRAVREGQPIVGECVRLHQRPEHERLYDVEVLAKTAPSSPKVEPKSEAQGASRKGPAMVNSEAFRNGWEGIFGSAPRKADLN
ncbi:MAG: hypothetical protein U0271_26150 [Polyangiaceae bacterium]